MKKVAIGGGQGFWGDSPDAAIHMIRNADIQYMSHPESDDRHSLHR